jgi:hypothetical protein
MTVMPRGQTSAAATARNWHQPARRLPYSAGTARNSPCQATDCAGRGAAAPTCQSVEIYPRLGLANALPPGPRCPPVSDTASGIPCASVIT